MILGVLTSILLIQYRALRVFVFECKKIYSKRQRHVQFERLKFIEDFHFAKKIKNTNRLVDIPMRRSSPTENVFLIFFPS